MKRFINILCVITGGSNGREVLERATILTNNNQARLTIVKVVDNLPSNRLLERVFSRYNLQAMQVEEYHQEIVELIEPWKDSIEMHIKVLVGTPFLEIIRQVLIDNHDLVIKTADYNELLGKSLTSEDMHLVRKCPCPVWILKPDSPKSYQKIMAAVDVADDYPPEELNTKYLLNLQILEMAISLAISELAELHIVHAWTVVGEDILYGSARMPEEEIVTYVEEVKQHHKKNLDILITKLIGKLGQQSIEYVKPKTHLLKGSAQTEIPAFAQKIKTDLIVMGTVARSGIPGFFIGNTAETILNHTDCSVLAIKPQGFETPVTIDT